MREKICKRRFSAKPINMTALILRTLKDRWFSVVILVAISIILTGIYVSMFPELQKQGQKMEELFTAYPKDMMKAFGIEVSSLAFTKIENFLAMEQYSFTWPILVIILTIGWAASALAGEIEKGTIEFLLSQPISRLKIFLGKYLSGVLALIFFVLFSVYSPIPLAKLFGVSFQGANYTSMAIIGFLFGLAIFSLNMFFSAVFSDKGKVYSAGAGIILIMYVVKIIANLKQSWDGIKYLSFFHYFDYNAALLNNKIDLLNVFVFVGITIFFFSLGLVAFLKRDAAV